MKCDITTLCAEIKRLHGKNDTLTAKVAALEAVDTTEDPVTDSTLAGIGTVPDPLRIAPQGAVAGQVLKFNGTTWLPADDEEGSGSTFACTDLATCSINSLLDVDTATVAPAPGDVLKWNGTVFAPAVDLTGGGGGAGTRVSQAEWETEVNSALNAAGDVRVWAPRDAIRLVEYRTGFRVVRNEAELASALADLVASIKVEGRIDLAAQHILAYEGLRIFGDSNFVDGFRVMGAYNALQIRIGNIKVEGLQFTSINAQTGYAVAILRDFQVAVWDNIVVRDCWIHDIGMGIYTQGGSGTAPDLHVDASDNRIDNLQMPGPPGTGFEGTGIFLAYNCFSNIKRNRITNTIRNGIWTGSGAHQNIEGNVITDAGRHGIEAFNSDTADIDENQIIDAFSFGISFATDNGGRCNDNTVTNAGDIGIELASPLGVLANRGQLICEDNHVRSIHRGLFNPASYLNGITINVNVLPVVVKGNIIGDMPGNITDTGIGIETTFSDHVTIVANEFVDLVTLGILINNGTDNIVMKANTFRAHSTLPMTANFVVLFVGYTVATDNVAYLMGGANPQGYYCAAGGNGYAADDATPMVPNAFFTGTNRIFA